MNALAQLEAWCANAVERTFAVIFPSALEPVQIARKLVATIERSPPSSGRTEPSRYRVRIGPTDFARLAPERTLLERQWCKMAEALCRRSGIAAAPTVTLEADASLGRGAIAIDADHALTEEEPPFVLRVHSGHDAGRAFALPYGDTRTRIVIGRDPACDVRIADPRVSRLHASVEVCEGALVLEDLASSNGTFRNGERFVRGPLRPGDRLRIGDTTLVLEAT